MTHKGHKRRTYRNLVGRPAGKKPLSRPKRRWEDIKTDLQEVGQVAGRFKCGNEPSGSITCGKLLD
jgi:hypothetical protein